jgi:hypothetical protein
VPKNGVGRFKRALKKRFKKKIVVMIPKFVILSLRNAMTLLINPKEPKKLFICLTIIVPIILSTITMNNLAW